MYVYCLVAECMNTFIHVYIHRSTKIHTHTRTTQRKYRMMSDHQVQMVKDNMSEFNVKFHGPKDSNNPFLFFIFILFFYFYFSKRREEMGERREREKASVVLCSRKNALVLYSYFTFTLALVLYSYFTFI